MLQRIGPYRLTRIIGRGGLGVVYRALDTRTQAEVALKLLTQPAKDTTAARRLAREFRALSGIQHRHIVRVLDAGAHEEMPYLVMELVDGLPLRAWLDARFDEPGWRPRAPLDDESVSVTRSASPPLGDDSGAGLHPPRDEATAPESAEPDSLPPHRRPWTSPRPDASHPEPVPLSVREALNRPRRVQKLRRVVTQLAEGLTCIHGHGLVHRDLKPSNVLVAPGGCAKLVDFGLVKVARSGGDTTAAGHLVGTYRYMSPEQARSGPVDGRSDLYALGSVLFEMLCGRPPFAQRQVTALLEAIVHEPPPAPATLNPEVDPALADLAWDLLRKNPEERVQTAAEVAERLRPPGGPQPSC